MKYLNLKMHLNLKTHATKNGNLPGNYVHLIVVSVLALLMLGASTAILAEPTLPPKSDCEVLFDDVYERLTCRQQAIADQLEYTSETAFADGKEMRGYINENRLNNIKNAKSKADRAVEKNTMKAFKRLAKSESRGHRGQNLGHLVPLRDEDDVPQDGICDYEQGRSDAKCAAVELDGNDLQECNPEKKNKGKGKGKVGKFGGLECDRWFDSEEDSDDFETADMDAIALSIDDSYDATEANLREMNGHLKSINENPPSKYAEVFLESQDENGICKIPPINQHLANSVIAMRVIHAAAEGTSDLVHNGCKQTSVALGFGGNGSLLCAVLDAAKLTANLAYIAVDEADKVQNGNVQAALANCVKQTADSIAGLETEILNLQQQLKDYVEITIHGEHKDIMDNDDGNMTTIMENDDENTTNIINVLNTPHGQREYFPVKETDKNKP